jgi:RNA polymerase sigma-70 factor (family 1)
MLVIPAILSNERQLFILMAQGDQAAFTKIFTHYESRLNPFILKITRSEIDTQEIVQELFIKLWTDREKMPQIENPRSYIFQMATHRTMNYLRSMARKRKHVGTAASQILMQKNTIEEDFDLKEMEDTIKKIVAQLPAQQQSVYKLSRQQGLKAKEIAERMNLAEKTVKNHLTEALRFIRERLEVTPGATITMIIFLVNNFR